MTLFRILPDPGSKERGYRKGRWRERHVIFPRVFGVRLTDLIKVGDEGFFLARPHLCKSSFKRKDFLLWKGKLEQPPKGS